MENQAQNFTRENEEQILLEILENTRKTRNYIKWQLIITVALVVLPFIAILAVIPMILRSVGSVYGGSLIQ